MKVLVVFGTGEGQTRKVAGAIGETLRKNGLYATVVDASEHPPAASLFDAVIIGSAVHLQRYKPDITRYIKTNLCALNALPTAFFSVCMSIAADDPKLRQEARNIADRYVAELGWQPKQVGYFAGALKFTQYGLLTKWIMKRISRREGHVTDTSHDYEYTDWVAVERFTRTFAEAAMHAMALP